MAKVKNRVMKRLATRVEDFEKTVKLCSNKLSSTFNKPGSQNPKKHGGK